MYQEVSAWENWGFFIKARISQLPKQSWGYWEVHGIYKPELQETGLLHLISLIIPAPLLDMILGSESWKNVGGFLAH